MRNHLLLTVILALKKQSQACGVFVYITGLGSFRKTRKSVESELIT